MNYSDKPTLAAWNEKCGVIAGTYLGDGAATRRIDLGKPIKAAIVLMYGRQLQDTNGNFYGGIASNQFTTPGVAIAETSLVVKESGISRTNSTGVGYYYIAFC